MIEGLGLRPEQAEDGGSMRSVKSDSPRSTVKIGIAGVPYLSMLIIET